MRCFHSSEIVYYVFLLSHTQSHAITHSHILTFLHLDSRHSRCAFFVTVLTIESSVAFWQCACISLFIYISGRESNAQSNWNSNGNSNIRKCITRVHEIFIKATATKVIGIKDPSTFDEIILFLFAVPSLTFLARSYWIDARILLY